MAGDTHSAGYDDLFEPVVELPDERVAARYERLVGLDDIKADLIRESVAVLNPDLFVRWAREFHGSGFVGLEALIERLPMFIFAGDVGTGKTALAESFGSSLATSLEIPIRVFKLSLSARGRGLVGEMTALISTAFNRIIREAHGGRNADGTARAASVLIVDEADALSQSRESGEMHHEDRAGVNALIRGIDNLASKRLPVLVILCTNRGDAIDPAVVRRAARIFQFGRPTHQQRMQLLEEFLRGVDLPEGAVARLSEAMAGGACSHTYSDIVQRIIPGAILAVAPEEALTEEALLEAISKHPPSSPF